MTGRRARLAALAGTALLLGCAGKEQPEAKPAASTLVVGIDVSGSFRDAHLYDDAIDFAAHYIYAHLNGLGGLRTPTALFVASVGGARPGEPKPFHPINDFQGRSVEQVAADLRAWFPSADAYTDFNAFFGGVRQDLVVTGVDAHCFGGDIVIPNRDKGEADAVADDLPSEQIAQNDNYQDQVIEPFVVIDGESE